MSERSEPSLEEPPIQALAPRPGCQDPEIDTQGLRRFAA